MMVAALNYAADAVFNLRENIGVFDKVDHKPILELCDAIERSVHFTVPDNGSIFDDKLRGLFGCAAMLPFPEITIEYKATVEENHPGLAQAPKRLIYARMRDKESLDRELRDNPWRGSPVGLPEDIYNTEHIIQVTAICNFCNDRGWIVMPGIGCVPSLGWDDFNGKTQYKPLKPVSDSAPEFVCFTIVGFIGIANYIAGKCNSSIEFWTHLTHDVAGEVATTLELCEALTCTNVSTEYVQRVDPGVNIRRARDKKLPLWETKALVVSVGSNKEYAVGDDINIGGNGWKSSPRQHLRRGHIRLLGSGKKVWVSSCIVGSGGKIDKVYRVERK